MTKNVENIILYQLENKNPNVTTDIQFESLFNEYLFHLNLVLLSLDFEPLTSSSILYNIKCTWVIIVSKIKTFNSVM